MYRFWISSLTVLIGLAPGVLAAAEVPTTLREALHYAVAHRPDVQVAGNGHESARLGVVEAKAGFYPTVTLLGSVQQNDVFGGNDFDARITDANGRQSTVNIEQLVPRYQSQLALDVALNLFAGGATAANVDRADALARSAGAQYTLHRGLVILEVASAHAALLKAYYHVRRLQRGLTLARSRALSQTERSTIEKEASEVDVADAELRVAAARSDLAGRWQEYLAALGMPSLSAPAPQYPPAITPVTDADLRAWLPEDAATSASVMMARAELEAAQATVAQESAAYFPQVDLFARYGYGSRRDGLDEASYVYKNDRVVGLRMSWNLFSGYQSQARQRRAALEQESRRWQAEQRARDWADAVRDRERRVVVLRDEVDLAEQRLALAEKRADTIKQLLNSRQATNAQHQQALLLREDAQDQLVVARLDLELARLALKLERIAGIAGASARSGGGSAVSR